MKMKSQKPLNPDPVTLDKLGHEINVPVRYSKKAKRIIIRINQKGIELILPNKNLKAGYRFLLEQEPWIRQKLTLMKEAHIDEIDSNTLPLLGKIYSLLYIYSDYNNIQIKDDTIHIYSLSSCYIQDLTKFLQDKLLSKVTKSVNLLSKQLKLSVTEIKVMNNKTKWGSCSSKAVLRFNWRLIFAPQEILEYVIIHEMCHLIEMNHSKSFWNLVGKLYPEYRSARLWLKQNAGRLHQYLTHNN